MASLTETTLPLENPDFIDLWIRAVVAKARTKKLRDSKETGGENEIISWCQNHYENFIHGSPIRKFVY